MSNFKVGDRVQVQLHPNDAYFCDLGERYEGEVTLIDSDGRPWVDYKYFSYASKINQYNPIWCKEQNE